jgi:hypothetical protein
MNIKEFVDKFPKCPKCGSNFTYEATLYSKGTVPVGGNHEDEKVSFYKDKVKIIIYDHTKDKLLNFSVSHADGKVSVYSGTKKSDIDKFESLTVSIFCEKCKLVDRRGFAVEYYGKYNSNTFTFENFSMDFFMFKYVIDDTLYEMSTQYLDNYSSLRVSNLNTGMRHVLQNLPVVELIFFDFSDREQIKQKFQTIMLLA